MKSITQFLFLSVFIFLSIIPTYSQQVDFFKRTPPKLSAKESQKVQNMRGGRAAEVISPVAVEKLAKVLSANNRQLKMTIPGKNKTYFAETKDIKTFANGDIEWTGKFKKGNGRALILFKGGETYGYFNIDGEEYNLQSLGVGKNVLVKELYIEPGTNICETEDNTKKGASTEEIEQARVQSTNAQHALNCGDTEVRVLVLFTPRAANRLANPAQTAEVAIANMNNALNNSRATGVRMTLAGTSPLNFTETRVIDTDVGLLATNRDAIALRNQFRADLVIMYTDGNYGPLGVAANIGPDNFNAFALVQSDKAHGIVFAHEAGHLFGARHQRGFGNNGPIEHAHNFRTGWFIFTHARQTIMYTEYNASRDINYFSNPDVNYKGEPTGTSIDNNSLKLRQTVGTIMNFRTSLTGPQTEITGLYYGEDNITYTWGSNFCSGSASGNPTYLWEVSFDGLNYTHPRNNTNSSFSGQLPLFGDLWLRLTLTFSNGDKATAFRRVYNTTPNPDHCDPYLISEVNRQNLILDPCVNELAVLAYPNPSTDELAVEYLVNSSGSVEMTLTEISGRPQSGKSIIIADQIQARGAYRKVITLKGIPSGTYKFTIKVNKETFSERIIVTN